MRFKKTTLAALCLAFASAAAYAAAGDRFFSNPTSNKDVVIQVNKAGVTTDVIKAEGATGAVTVGPTAGATHKIFVSDSVNGLELRKSGGTYGQGFHFDVFGTEARIISTGDAAGSLKFYTGGTDVGGFSTSGAWTLGASSGTPQTHVVNGSMSLTNSSSTESTYVKGATIAAAGTMAITGLPDQFSSSWFANCRRTASPTVDGTVSSNITTRVGGSVPSGTLNTATSGSGATFTVAASSGSMTLINTSGVQVACNMRVSAIAN